MNDLFCYRNASVLPGSPFGKGHEAIINRIDCNGTEPDLVRCTSSPWNIVTCGTDEVATVDCHVQRKYESHLVYFLTLLLESLLIRQTVI